jgi:6-phosphogluconate dehydrogenase (decarboxylating)
MIGLGRMGVAFVEETIAALEPLLERGDILINDGNSRFHDDLRRASGSRRMESTRPPTAAVMVSEQPTDTAVASRGDPMRDRRVTAQ